MNRVVAPAIAGTLAAVSALVVADVSGVHGGAIVAGVCAALAGLVVIRYAPRASSGLVRAEVASRRAPRRAYPRFDAFETEVGWATRDGRSFDVTLAPTLRDLALDVCSDPGLDRAATAGRARAEVGEQWWARLDADKADRRRARSGPIDPRRLDELITSLERLHRPEEPWS